MTAPEPLRKGERPLLAQVEEALWAWLRENPSRAGEYEVRVAIGNIRVARIKANIEREET